MAVSSHALGIRCPGSGIRIAQKPRPETGRWKPGAAASRIRTTHRGRRTGSIIHATMAFRIARRVSAFRWVIALLGAAIIPLVLVAQNAGRGAIQTPGGGRGPGAAPDA